MMKLFSNKIWRTALSIVLVCAFLQLTACGTILYPERKGQKAGQLDIGVVILDALGLLCFIIPGVIAFAVDFNNGTIYLPGGKGKSGSRPDLKVVRFDPKDKSPEQLERLIEKHTDRKVALNDQRMIVYEADGTQDPRAFVLNANR